jgi:hypothetical protein
LVHCLRLRFWPVAPALLLPHVSSSNIAIVLLLHESPAGCRLRLAANFRLFGGVNWLNSSCNPVEFATISSSSDSSSVKFSFKL